MFCSNCGKTFKPEDAVCPHCGASMSEDRFNGSMYTSVQARIPADAVTGAPQGSMSYTRTDYMSYDNQPQPDVYSNTTYRPLLQEHEDERLNEEQAQMDQAPEAVDPEISDEAPQDAMFEDELSADAPTEELYQEPQDVQEDVPAQDVAEELKHIPLPQVEEGRINPDIEEFMQALDEKQARNADRRQANGGRRFQMPAFLSRRPAEAPIEQEAEAVYDEPQAQPMDMPVDEPTAEAAQELQEAYDPSQPYDEYAPEQAQEEMGEAYDDYNDYNDYADEGDAPNGNPLAGLMGNVSGLFRNNVLLKRILAGVLILAVLVGGIVWLSYVTAARSKIAGVTYETYAKGTELLKGYLATDYRTKFIETYGINANYAQSMMDTDQATLMGLAPSEPMENDAAFVKALANMQNTIAGTLLEDARAAKEGTQDARKEQSDQEWQIINNSIAKLLAATNMSELTTIGTQIAAAAQPTEPPKPTDAPSIYVTLQKGMKDSTAVQTMQARLIELGYLSGTADGDFGNMTMEAIKVFQQQAGLNVDGIATSQVQAALYDPDAPEAPVTETPSPEESPAPESSDVPANQ